MSEEITNKIDTIGHSLHEIKKTNNERFEKLEKGVISAELEDKVSKMAEDITKQAETVQKMSMIQQEVKKSSSDLKTESIEKTKELAHEFAKCNNFNGNFGEFLSAKGLTDVEKKDLSVVIDSEGGYTVRPEVLGITKTREFETSPIRQLATVLSVNSDSLEIPIDSDEASAQWVSEKVTGNKTSSPAFKMKRINLYEIEAKPLVTQKFLDVADFDLAGWLQDKINSVMGRMENTAFVSGNGVSKPRGFLDYPAWDTSGVYQGKAIEQINSGTAGKVNKDGFIKLQGSLKEHYQSNAAFIMSRSTFTDTLTLSSSDDYIFIDTNPQIPTGTAFSLLGKPVYFASDMPEASANSLSIAYGDFRAGYYIIERPGLNIMRDPYTEKPYVMFYTRKMVGGDVVNYESIKLQKLAA